MRTTLALALTLTVAGCFSPPVEYDMEVGREVALEIEQDVGLYGDAELDAWFQGVAARVAGEIGETPFEYRFAILDQPEPNAFAAPGGFVYVSRGLLALLESEDELAGVIGHELIHVEERHSVAKVRRSILPGILQVPGNLVGVVSGRLGNLINSPLVGLEALRSARYGRGQETESDELGQVLAAGAGYDPAALATILERMGEFETVVAGEQPGPSFFDSHPATPGRAERLREGAEALEMAPRAAEALDRERLLDVLDGLTFGPNLDRGVFLDRRFVHPRGAFLFEAPEFWATFQTADSQGASSPGGASFVLHRWLGPGLDVDLVVEGRRSLLTDELGAEPVEDRPNYDERGQVVAGRRLAWKLESDFRLVQSWTRLGEDLHEWTAVLAPDDQPDLESTLESLRPLSQLELASLRSLRVRPVAAFEGETFGDLVERVGSPLEASWSGALNGLEPASPLEAGRRVKVILAEPLGYVGADRPTLPVRP